MWWGVGEDWLLVGSESKEFRGLGKARAKEIGGGATEVYCGLRQENYREGNSGEEWMGEVGGWRFWWRRGVR